MLTRERVAVGSWVLLVAIAVRWGQLLLPGSGAAIGAPPFFGHWDLHLAPALLPAIAIGIAVVGFGPALARTLRWSNLLLATGLSSAAWTVALAASDGWHRVTAPLTGDHEYEPYAARIADVGTFLRTFVDRFGEHPVHVRGHPPGVVVVAAGLDRVHLGGAGWLAVVCIGGWASAAVVALAVARRVGGEDAARRAAPALVVLPAAVWAGTSADGLLTATGAVAVGLCIVAVTGRRPTAVVAAGVAVFAAVLGTYGFVPLLVLPVAVLAIAPDRRPAFVALTVVGAVAATGLVVLAATTGFWWPSGLAATREAYWSGRARLRPGWYFTLAGNPGALALSTGPAVAAGLAALGRNRAAVLPVAALLAVAVADVSQLSRAEVERIWLPFVPWLALAAPGHRRGWLGAQVGLGLALQAGLRTPW